MTNSAFKNNAQCKTARKPMLMLALIVLMMLNACSPEQSTSPATVDSKSVASLDNVKTATIQIVAEGSFVDPTQGTQTAAGAGSGFIIDKSGLAVTNNHVVTGAALLKVYVGGESKPRNARILGVSECSDLAVIDIDGEGYPFLEWYTGNIEASLEVYAAGFPLGDPEYTVTRGIVAKEHTSGETSWASVDSVIEIDAKTWHGNSGGPLVTKDGQVVGVNYAGNDSTGQNYAIAQAEALRVIDQLRAGQDVNSLGLNGEAISDGQGLSGIWVASVKSGSAANKAGIRAGDLLTQLEGLPLASDGTMADYCDILRSHRPDDALAVEVWRISANEVEVLKGEINGDKLTQFAVIPLNSNKDTTPTSAPSTSTDYESVTDDLGAITLEVPTSWRERTGTALTSQDNQVIGASIMASPDLQEFSDTTDTPGVFFVASRKLGTDANVVLDTLKNDNSTCQYQGRNDYDSSSFTGRFDLWTGCGDAKSSIIKLAAASQSGDFLIYYEIHMVSKADLEAPDHIVNSLNVTGKLP